MKNTILATSLACALIGVCHAEAKTKNHNRPVQMVETAPQPQPGDGGYHQASGFEMVKASQNYDHCMTLHGYAKN